MNPSDIEFLASLPHTGGPRVLELRELHQAFCLHEDGLCLLTPAHWPDMYASITFRGRKALQACR